MNQKLSVFDPGDKPTDIGDERSRRTHALVHLGQAIENEARVVAEAAAATEKAASTAMWLGASLADLAAVTGKTRQAARKRWPALGVVHRRRLWLANHVDDIRWAVRVLLDNEADITVPDTSIFAEMTDLDASVGRNFDESAVHEEAGPADRWFALDRLVDVVLRRIVDDAVTSGGQAEFAVFGARGVVGYYDHAVDKPETDSGLT
ncbi:hypothetical protein [Rhodococcus sp. 114MFTsu3.1]|uniref:hypothetical protein n=1 Tax=Rhodococcus sp. 114MFTsu3.1 TaxID=1172184 RepID=UPI00036892BA|nr:hypothetical protein [Rhodococcus sp. 114MFTsu3.1]